MVTGYDVIGDVHGSATKLAGLLDVLGWTAGADGRRRHPDGDRTVVFVGDLIDRGDEQRAVLELVRAMVDAGDAQIVMGNHELNALAWATPNPDRPGRFLRGHTAKNRRQHAAFLTQLDDDERASWLAWFRTLPLWLDLGGLRVVHACWHADAMAVVQAEIGGARFPDGPDGDALLQRALTPGTPLFRAVEILCKGPEIDLRRYGLPPYRDKGGHTRHVARVRWWTAEPTSVRDVVDIPQGTTTLDGAPYPDLPDVPCLEADRRHCYTDDVPVVYGHHWRRWEPEHGMDWTPRTACVDFSAVVGGPLVAYRFEGEPFVDPTHYERYPSA